VLEFLSAGILLGLAACALPLVTDMPIILLSLIVLDRLAVIVSLQEGMLFYV